MTKNTVLINGVRYDAHTGMRLDGDTSHPEKKSVQSKTTTASNTIHKKADRTKTLAKRHTKAGKRTTLLQEPPKTPTKSPHISKFAKQTPAAARAQRVISDIGPQSHPVQSKHRQAKAVRESSPAVPPAHVIKSKAITDAVAKSNKKSHKKAPFLERHSRQLLVSSVIAISIVAIGYVCYMNIPAFSVKIAASKAGIAADYPSYQPSGYRLDSNIQAVKNEVTMRFDATAGPQSFTLIQAKSNWDSSALLENYVKPNFDSDYETYTDSGLTIYIHDIDAAWVNGGILHTITGDAPLSQEQIRKVATSM